MLIMNGTTNMGKLQWFSSNRLTVVLHADSTPPKKRKQKYIYNKELTYSDADRKKKN